MSKITTYAKITTIAATVIISVSSRAANAEDGDYSYNISKPNSKNMQQITTNDQQYTLPKEYDGKYYPNEDSQILYHGTTQTSEIDRSGIQYIKGGEYYYYY